MYEMDLTLDVNSDLYSVEEGDKFRLAISTTLSLDGTPGADHWGKVNFAANKTSVCMHA